MSGKVGDNVFRASGVVAAAAAGRTGTVDWVTTPKVTGDSPITAVTGEGYFLNTTAGQITVNLPVGVAGSIVSLADYAGTWDSNLVTVTPNGSEKIGAVAGSVFLVTEDQTVTFIYVDSTQGWLNTLDSTSSIRAGNSIVATVSGACNTLATAPCCSDVKIATFKGPGTFCVSEVGGTLAENTASYMLVAGGGARQPAQSTSGGGGGGGFREYEAPGTPYTASPLDGGPGGAGCGTAAYLTVQAYPITVGAGGTPSPTGPGSQGNNSIFGAITSTGGGSGSGPPGNPSGGNTGGSGGGGGGACHGTSPGGAGNTPPVTPAQGTAGGNGVAPGASYSRGGGGGGATVAGATGAASGTGGAGATTSISASPTIYAGGGGGGSNNYTQGGPGPGGGGSGGAHPGCSGATDGTANTGGGAGAGYSAAKNGGSGIVIIRYQFQ